jgi:hypothetical protein
VWQVARHGLRETGQKLGYAWLSGCTLVVRENLGVPLMLASAWLALRCCAKAADRSGAGLGRGVGRGDADGALAAAADRGAGSGAGAGLGRMARATGIGPGGGRGADPGAMGLAQRRSARHARHRAGHAGGGDRAVASPLPPDLHPFDATLGRLVMFWWPHLPDAGPHALSRAMTYMRIGEVTQYITLFTLGLPGWSRRTPWDGNAR